MCKKLEQLIEAWRESGRVAFVYPRKRRVSLNGGPGKTYEDATVYLADFFSKHHHTTRAKETTP